MIVSQFLNQICEEPDVTQPLKSTFILDEFVIDKICNEVGGVVEYTVQEMEEDDIEEELARL